MVVTCSPSSSDASPVPWISAMEMGSSGSVTVMSKDVEAVSPASSVTVTSTVLVPGVVGVPVISPPVAVRPSGSPVTSNS